jgi:hypothetical protein
MRLQANAVTRFVVLGGLTGIGLAVYLVRHTGSPVESAAALLLYAFSCELYLFLVTLARNSVSATLLLLLCSGPMAAGEIGRRLGSAGMVSFRIEGLVATGLLRQTALGYEPTDRGVAVISLFSALKRFFGHERFPG